MKENQQERYFGAADFVIFIGLLLVSAAIGAYFAYRDRRDKSTDTYYFASRRMSPFSVGMSMAVSYISAMTIISYPVEAYLYGPVFVWAIPALFCSAALSILYYIPLIHRLRLRSIYEYLELRFGSIVRRLCVGMVVPGELIYMGITVYIPALALNAVTPLSLGWSIAITSVICTFYTTVGGIKAVIWTDVLQGMVMIFGSLALLIKTTVDLGGIGNVAAAAERGHRNNFIKLDSDPRERSTTITWFLGLFIISSVTTCCTQVMSQRYLSCKSAREAKLASAFRILPVALFVLIAGGNGLAMYALFEGCDPVSANLIQKRDQTTPMMAVQVFHDLPGMAGLFVSAAYSGTLSSVSSGINTLAILSVEDVIKPRWPEIKESTETVISKVLSLFIGILIMAIAYITSLLESNVIQIVVALLGIIRGPILSVFTMGIFVPWTNKWGAFFGMLLSWILTAWMCVGSIVHKPAPEFRQTLPLTTELCNYSIDIVANSSALPLPYEAATGSGDWAEPTASYAATTDAYRDPLADTLYSVSPYLYGVFGFLSGCVAMFLISLVTGLNKASEADPELFVPLVDNERIFPKCVTKFFRFGVPELAKKSEKPTKLEYVDGGQEENMLPEKKDGTRTDSFSSIGSSIDMRP